MQWSDWSSDVCSSDLSHRQKMYSQEFNIRSIKEESCYKWQFGLFGFMQDYMQTNDADYRQTGRHVMQDVHNPTEGFAAYHQSAFDDLPVKGLSVFLGIRYDFEKTNNSLIRTTIEKDKTPVSAPTENDGTSFSQIIPKASVQYAFGDENLVYFTVAKGYKTGGFNTTAEDEKDRTFAPEHSWCHELGVKNSSFDGFFIYDLAFFLINWDNQQISQLKPTGEGFLIRNAGKTKSRGVEMSSQLNLSRSLNIQASYGITDAKYVSYKESETTGYDGNYLPMVPRNTATLGANYSIKTNLLLDKIVLHGQYTSVGRLYWNDANDTYQSHYEILNGKVSFIKDKFSIDFWAKNIGGKEYIAYYFTSMGGTFVQKGKPFTCGMNLNIGF
jgi:outer membrane receptor protein involved in Fe transport